MCTGFFKLHGSWFSNTLTIINILHYIIYKYLQQLRCFRLFHFSQPTICQIFYGVANYKSSKYFLMVLCPNNSDHKKCYVSNAAYIHAYVQILKQKYFLAVKI